MLRIATTLVFLAALTVAAQAQRAPNVYPWTDSSGTVGTSASVLKAVPATNGAGVTAIRYFLRVQNLGPGNISCTYDGTTPVASAAGTTYYPVGSGDEWTADETGTVPQGAVTCISSAANTAVTVKVYER